MVNPIDNMAYPLRRATAPSPLGDQIPEYSRRGLRYAQGLLRNGTDAEEVVQEAFCRLLMSRHATADDEDFAAVFFTAIRNLCIDVIRRRQRHPTMPLKQAIEDPQAGVETTQRLAQLQQSVREAMGELPRNWADALRLRIDGELSYDEIARVLKCSKGQVRTWLYRARRQLEQTLAQQELVNYDG